MIIRRLQNMDEFSEIECGLAKFILENSKDVCSMNIKELAEATYVATATITRFCRKIGASGFNDFKIRLSAEYSEYLKDNCNVDENIPFDKDDCFDDIIEKIYRISIDGIRETKELLLSNNITNIVKRIEKSTIINIFGEGSSLDAAYEFKNKMLRLGKKIHIEKGYSEQLYQAANLDKTQCAIIISYSGENEDSLNITKMLSEKRIFTVAITSEGNNSISRSASCQICTGTCENKELSKKLETFSSHMAVHFILDIIYSMIYVSNYEDNYKKTKQNEEVIRRIIKG